MTLPPKQHYGLMKVIRPGTLTMIVDQGRAHAQRYGYSESGAADEYSFLWANRLLDNPLNSAAIAVHFGGFEADFFGATQIAITGAHGDILLNQKSISGWQTHSIKSGDRLKILPPKTGITTYIAIKQGVKSRKFLNSQSHSQREKIQLSDGWELNSTANIFYRRHDNADPQRSLNPSYIPKWDSPLTLNLIPGYQFKHFDSLDLENTLFKNPYEISLKSNRMGFQLKGTKIPNTKSALLSEGIAMGAVQIPPSGQPIVLLKERQTIGGYPKLGCVSQIDCFALSQRKPGQLIRFALSDVQREQERLKSFYQQFSPPA